MIGKTIKINDRTIEIKKMPLGNYSDFVEIVQSAAERLIQENKLSLKALEVITLEGLMELVPAITRHAMDDLLRLLELATPLTAEDFKNEDDPIGLADVKRILETVYEVNEFDEIKKAIGQLFGSNSTEAGSTD